MPTINKVWTLPQGDSVEILENSAMTGGERTRVRLVFKPGGSRVPPHRHLLQDEKYEMISGTMTYTLDGKKYRAEAGTKVTLPKAVLHEHYTEGLEDAVAIQTMTPGLDFDYLVENLFGLGSEGRGVNPIDALLQGLVWIRKAKGPFYLAIPIWAQRVLAFIVSPIAYLFGYRTVYQRFSGEEW
jgi:quercetin dioxygenase-like cupin family protein